jgi:hypothetical protein
VELRVGLVEVEAETGGWWPKEMQDLHQAMEVAALVQWYPSCHRLGFALEVCNVCIQPCLRSSLVSMCRYRKNKLLTEISSAICSHRFFRLHITRGIMQGPSRTMGTSRPVNMHADNVIIGELV